jgi:hypothetical protein
MYIEARDQPGPYAVKADAVTTGASSALTATAPKVSSSAGKVATAVDFGCLKGPCHFLVAIDPGWVNRLDWVNRLGTADMLDI